MKNILSFILLAALAWCLRAEAVEKTYTVEDLVALLLQANPSLRIQERALAIDTASLRLEGRLPNPRLAAAAGSGRPLAGSEGERRLWEAGIEWTLPNPVARAHAQRGRRWQERAAQAWSAGERRQLVHEFKARLYELQSLTAKRRIQREMVADLQRVAAVVDARAAAGEALRLDSLWARSSLTLALNRQREIDALIAILDREIHADLDGSLPPGIAVREDAALPPPPPGPEELEPLLLKNPALAARRAQLAVSAAQLASGKSAWFPDLAMSFERAREVDASTWKGAIALELPVFSGSWSRLPLLRYQRQRAALEVRRQELQDRSELARRLAEITALKEALAAFDGGELAAGREAVHLAEAGLRAGELSLLHYLEARKNLLEMSVKRAELVAGLRTAHSALDVLLGGWQ